VSSYVADGYDSEAKLEALQRLPLAAASRSGRGPQPAGKLFVFSADGDQMMPRSFPERLLMARYGGVLTVDHKGTDAVLTPMNHGNQNTSDGRRASTAAAPASPRGGGRWSLLRASVVTKGFVPGRTFAASAVAQEQALEAVRSLEAAQAAAEAKSDADADADADAGASEAKRQKALEAARVALRVARLEGLAGRWGTVSGGHGTFFGDQPAASDKYRSHLESIGLVGDRRAYLAALKEARHIANSKGKPIGKPKPEARPEGQR
jgi:hypothetical protein